MSKQLLLSIIYFSCLDDYFDENFKEKFEETKLPGPEFFYNKLTREEISHEDYAHAEKVFKQLKCTSLKTYTELYVGLDTCLLADCFEHFRQTCLDEFHLDPANFLSTPGIVDHIY